MSVLRISALVFVCCGLVSAVSADESATADWSRVVAIDVPAGVTAGLVEFPLTEEVFDGAKADLSDLRIFDPTGAEVGYILTPPAEAPADLVPVALSHRVESDAARRTTEIAIDLGYRNLPLFDTSLAFSDSNFSRKLAIYGRNSQTHIAATPREDAPPQERTVETPWELVADGAIHRYTAGGRPDESLTIALRPARFRYLKVRIDNANDPPLGFTGAAVRRLVYHVSFQPKPGKACRLYFGNPKAARPAYDLAQYADRLRAEGVSKASLGKSVPNPAKRRAKLPPWSERNMWIVWVALVAGLAILGTLVLRQLKAAKDPPQSNPSA